MGFSGDNNDTRSLAESSPEQRTSSGMLSTLLTSPGGAAVTKTYTAAIDKASTYYKNLAPQSVVHSLSSSLRRRGSSSSPTPSPSPALQVCIRRVHSLEEDVTLTVTPETTLAQLREGSARAAGVLVKHQYIIIEEQRPADDGGLMTALKNTAVHLTSRERMVQSVAEWVNFLFLPEAVNREVRGKGLTSWAREHVLPYLQPPPPPHIVQITVLMLCGRRCFLELSHTASLHKLSTAIERATAIPASRQRILVVERLPPTGLGPLLFWTVARIAYGIACRAAAATSAWARFIVLGPGYDQTMKLKLQTTRGEEVVQVAVRQDMTLGQLQAELQLQHGDHVNLEGLLVTAGSTRDPGFIK